MTPKELREMAENKALDIGTAWNALEAAAERIETLEADCASLKQRAWRAESRADEKWGIRKEMNFWGLAQMNADGQRAPAIGAGGRDSLARKTDCVAGRNAVKSAQSYRIPDHCKSNPTGQARPQDKEKT